MKTLIKQGHFLCLAMLEKSDMIWKSQMFNLKKGTLKFLLNSCLDTLPTQTNLLQWGTSASNLCKLCLQADAELQGRRQKDTNKVALHQKRYTWRYNNLIRYITGLIDILIDPWGGTVPPNLIVTAQKPEAEFKPRLKYDWFHLKSCPSASKFKSALN